MQPSSGQRLATQLRAPPAPLDAPPQHGRDGSRPLTKPGPPPNCVPPTADELSTPGRASVAGPVADITVVTTAEQLVQAVAEGAVDIEIRAHLDLRGLTVSHEPELFSPQFQGSTLNAGGGGGVHPRSALVYVHRAAALRSIRGICKEPDPIHALGLAEDSSMDRTHLPLKPHQCMLVTDSPLLTINSSTGKLVVDNLYVKLTRHTANPSMAIISVLSFLRRASSIPPGGLFVTTTTFHSSSQRSAIGIRCDGSGKTRRASVYIEDCIFTSWSGASSPITLTDSTANVRNSVFTNIDIPLELVDISFGGLVRFESVILANVSIHSGHVVSTTSNDYASVFSTPLHSAHSESDERQALYYYNEDDTAYDVPITSVPAEERGVFGEEWRIGKAAMLNCNPLFTGDEALFEDTTLIPRCISGLPTIDIPDDYVLTDSRYPPSAELQVKQLLRADDGWLCMTRQALPPPLPANDWPQFVLDPPPDPQPRSSLAPDHSSGFSGLVPNLTLDEVSGGSAVNVSPQGSSRLAGGMAAALGVVAGCIIIAGLSAFVALVAYRRSLRCRKTAGTGCCGIALTTQSRTRYTKFDLQESKKDKLQRHEMTYLHRQLNLFGEDDLFHGTLEVQRQCRRQGGRALVQVMETPSDRCEFAVKFFLDREAFLTEAALYAACLPAIRNTASPAVLAQVDAAFGSDLKLQPSGSGSKVRKWKFLPPVSMVCDGGTKGMVDPKGQPLPPCIVTEYGQSLQEWLDRRRADNFSALAVLLNVSMRLAEMHEAGLVHRNVKPSNVLWISSESKWVLDGFWNVARIGETAPVNFAIAYAAPEAASAAQLLQHDLRADPALDAWALGVIALELFTDAPVFDLIQDGHSRVLAQLQGHRPLPWEGDSTEEFHNGLGILAGPVLQLLQRTPSQRPSLRRFHETCMQAFAIAQHSGHISR